MSTSILTKNNGTLSIEGGKPIRKEPFPPWPYFANDEIEAAVEVLKSGKVNYWTGSHGKMFEQEFAKYSGTDYAVALSNGTIALELALRILNIGDGDEVIVTCRSFVASASTVVLCGATPVFADVNSISQNVTAETIQKVITPKTKAIIAVHLAGWPCDMDPIMKLAREHDITVIEDCAQAHGATYYGRPVGSLGHLAAFSFCQDKIVTTGGEGGMLTTNDPELWEKAWAFKDHGKNFQLVSNVKKTREFKWLHESFGTNGRMTEMQAAIGRSQLGKLNSWVTLRRRNAAILTESFSRIPALRITCPTDEIEHAYYKYYVFVKLELLKSGWTRDRIVEAINAEGILCQTGICPEIYLEKAFQRHGLQPKERLPMACHLGETSLMFLVHPTLNENDMLDTCRAVEKVFVIAGK